MTKNSIPAFTGPDLCAKQAHEVVDLLRKKAVSPNELLQAAFERIEAVEPQINAMPTTCRARAEGAIATLQNDDADIEAQMLAGMPIGIKDLTEVEGVRTTFGTKGLADFVPEANDALVTRLERRGGIVVGKTNTPEFGAGGNTFNDVFGPTRNVWDTRLNAAGSSGGAAASLASGEVWLSHGSDHGGSLRTPAAYNGIVGLRPSPGVVASNSAAGFLIEGQQGPMARSVRDCALFLDAMAGFDSFIPTSWPAPDTPYQEAAIRATDKVRIAFSPDLNGISPVEPEMDACLRAALTSVEKNGGTVDEACPDLDGLKHAYHTQRGLLWASVLSKAPAKITDHMKPTLLENLKFGQKLSVDDVVEAGLARTRIFNAMHELLQTYDVLACPVVGCMPRPVEQEWIDEINGVKLTNYMDWLSFAFLSTTTGLPAISVPVGLNSDGVPVGIQLIGPHRGEAKLIAVAAAVERAVGGPFGPIDPVVRHQ